jgi:hypothetical protein
VQRAALVGVGCALSLGLLLVLRDSLSPRSWFRIDDDLYPIVLAMGISLVSASLGVALGIVLPVITHASDAWFSRRGLPADGRPAGDKSVGE